MPAFLDAGLQAFLPAFLPTLLPALLPTLFFGPSFDCFLRCKEHCETSVKRRRGGEQQQRCDYYNPGLTERENGIIIVATLLLFPTAAALYGGFAVFFAAKEAVERRAKEKGRQEGRQEGREEGRQAERERVNRVLAEAGVVLTPELVKKLAGEDG